MKKLLIMVIAVMGLGVSLTAAAACVGQQQQSGPWVYVPEEHK